MDTFGTSTWVKFFTDSGIPHGVACNYAVTFTDNRITKNMLLDLNKEILQDMGINVMGDVIAILKHSKVVHDQITRAKVFESEASIAPVLPERRNTPVTRLVDHYTKQKATSPSWTTPAPSKLVVQPMESPSPKIAVTAKRSLVQSEEVPQPKKVRRVLPEHEGGYKISMPAGSTPKTKRLLQQQKAMASQSPVFQRLGVEPGAVARTGNPRVSKLANTNGIKKLAQAAPVVRSAKQSSSVFARLGPEMSSGGEDEAEDIAVVNRPQTTSLPYHGILKTAAGVKKTSVLPLKAGRSSLVGKTALKKIVSNNGSKFVLSPEVRRIAVPLSTSAGAIGRVGVGSQGILASKKASTTPGVQGRLGAKARLGPAPSKARQTVAFAGLSTLQASTLPSQKHLPTMVRTTHKLSAQHAVVTKNVRKFLPAGSPVVLRGGSERAGLPKKLGVFSRLGPMVDM